MKDPEVRKVVWENALSVIKKLLIGSFVIILWESALIYVFLF